MQEMEESNFARYAKLVLFKILSEPLFASYVNLVASQLSPAQQCVSYVPWVFMSMKVARHFAINVEQAQDKKSFGRQAKKLKIRMHPVGFGSLKCKGQTRILRVHARLEAFYGKDVARFVVKVSRAQGEIGWSYCLATFRHSKRQVKSSFVRMDFVQVVPLALVAQAVILKAWLATIARMG